MPKATDFQNVADSLREAAWNWTQNEGTLAEVYNFYTKNQADAYWTGLGDNDEIGASGITKAQFVAVMTLYQNLEDFMDNVAVSAADRRATIEQARATA